MAPVLGAIVPAAGRSVRMGRAKPLLALGATDFIGRILETIRGCAVVVAPVVVVRRDGDRALADRLEELAGADLHVATVPDEGGDMWRSLCTGAGSLGAALGALVWPVDVPAVRPDTVAAVCRAALASPTRAAQPVVEGRVGHPTYVPCVLFDQEGQPGAEPGLRGRLSTASLPPTRVEVTDPFSLLNVNTPADYEALVSALRE